MPRPSSPPPDPTVIVASRKLRLRFNGDRSVLAQVGTARPVVVLVGCDPISTEALVAIARVWSAGRQRTTRAGIAPGAAGGPPYKFKVSSIDGGRHGLRLWCPTAAGPVSVPEKGKPAMAIDERDPAQCAAVATTLLARLVESQGTGSAGPGDEHLAALTKTFSKRPRR